MRNKISAFKNLDKLLAIVLIYCSICQNAYAQSAYLVQPGDILTVSVWKEPDLTGDVIVHPDGTFSLPLIGVINANNRPISEIQTDVKESLIKYIPDAPVSIGLKQSIGTLIFVIGQVNNPGAFTVHQPTDVLQALTLAGGMTAYASTNKIRILRRNKNTQVAISFRYGDVTKGEKLEQNIVLKNGDVVVVP